MKRGPYKRRKTKQAEDSAVDKPILDKFFDSDSSYQVDKNLAEFAKQS